MKNTISIRSISLVALFAALTFLGTTIKIPVPTGGFIHLGNSIFLLAVLLIGYKKGALAGGLGFAIFDILNGYAIEAPYFIFESFIVGGAATLAILLFRNKIDSINKILTVTIITGIAKIIMTQLKNTTMLLLAGSNLSIAFTKALTKLPATIVNVISTIIIVTVIYFPLKKAISKIITAN